MQHLFAHNTTKKADNETREKPKAKYLCIEKIISKEHVLNVRTNPHNPYYNTEANLANGIYNPEPENKFSVAIFLKKKSTNQKKN